MTIWHYILYVDIYIYITVMVLMWHRYKMPQMSFKGHFKVKVNELILLEWLLRISIVTNLGEIIVEKNIFEISPKVKGFCL